MLYVKSPAEVGEIMKKSFGHIVTPSEKSDIKAALGRTLAEDITADSYVPGFDRSTVDGYAVKASDTFGASDATPSMLIFKGEALMGHSPQPIGKGECLYVPTGGEIPEAADAMVMIEDTEDYGDNFRYILRATAPGRHISFKGDDVCPGKCILKQGKLIRPQDIGTLAALGVSVVSVRMKPKVGVISTGDELIDISKTPEGAQIRDINSHLLCAGIEAVGGAAVPYGIVKDDFGIIKSTVLSAVNECDIIVMSGSSSVGNHDHARKVIDTLIDEIPDSGLLLHGVAMKPGKPMLAAKIMGKPVFGLPGHPMAAYFTFRIFTAELIASMLGREPEINAVPARLSVNIPSNHGREECVAVSLEKGDGGLIAVPVIGKSGLITVLSRADGYLRIPREHEGFAAGTDVTVYLL